MKVTEWRLKMSENVQSVMGKLNGSADATASRFSHLQNTLNGSGFQNFAGEIPGMGRGASLLGSGAMLAGAGVAALGTALYKCTELAVDYEKGMAKINATAQLTAPELAKLKSELMEVGENSRGNFERVPDAFEKINSSLNNVTKSMAVLKIANKSAQAGFVDIDLAAGALSQTVSIL